MKFLANITAPSGKLSAKRAIIPPGYIRMDDGETYRLIFENDWSNNGTISYLIEQCAYENIASKTKEDFPIIGGIDPRDIMVVGHVKTIGGGSLEIAAGEIEVPNTVFTYNATKPGGFYRIQVFFTRDGAEEYIVTLFLINNDYNKDGTAVDFGERRTDAVLGRAVRREDDPDRDQRAFDNVEQK